MNVQVLLIISERPPSNVMQVSVSTSVTTDIGGEVTPKILTSFVIFQIKREFSEDNISAPRCLISMNCEINIACRTDFGGGGLASRIRHLRGPMIT